MTETKYIRKRSAIYSTEKNEDGSPVEHEQHKSINAAKRESRELQQANGGLGAGYVKTN